MSTVGTFLLIMGSIAFVSWRWLIPLARFADHHPSWYRQWRLSKGSHDECPRCGKLVPVGYIEARRDHYEADRPAHPNSLFALAGSFDSQLDGGYLMGGGICAICEQDYSYYEEQVMREIEHGVEPTLDWRGRIKA